MFLVIIFSSCLDWSFSLIVMSIMPNSKCDQIRLTSLGNNFLIISAYKNIVCPFFVQQMLSFSCCDVVSPSRETRNEKLSVLKYFFIVFLVLLNIIISTTAWNNWLTDVIHQFIPAKAKVVSDTKPDSLPETTIRSRFENTWILHWLWFNRRCRHH